MIYIKLLSAKLDEGVLVSNPDYEVEVAKIADNLRRAFGASRVRAGTYMKYGVNEDLFDFNWFLYCTSKEGIVENYRANIKLPEAKLSDITPDYLPNREIPQWDNTDPETPVELPPTYKTWDEWRSNFHNGTETHPILLHEGFAYFVTQSGGRDLTNAELLQLYADGIEIVDNLPVIEEMP